MKEVQKSKNFGYAELEKEYGIKRNTAYSLVAQNRIPHIRLGNRFVLFERDAIEAHFAAHRVAIPNPMDKLSTSDLLQVFLRFCVFR